MLLVDKLFFYLQYPFVQYALIVGVLISVSTSLLGVPLVLKRLSFLSTGLSNFAFAVTCIVSVTGLLNNIFIVLLATIVFAMYLLCFNKGNKLTSGDTSLAILSVGSLSVGYLSISLFSKSANVTADVCKTLFGSTSILTLSFVDVVVCTLLSILVVVVFIVLNRSIISVTFDEDFGVATGQKVKQLNIIMAVLTAVVIVLALNLVGSLLISALIVIPTMISVQLFKSFKSVVVFSAVLSGVCSFVGICVAILVGSPVGVTIVVLDLIVYFVVFVITRIKR